MGDAKIVLMQDHVQPTNPHIVRGMPPIDTTGSRLLLPSSTLTEGVESGSKIMVVTSSAVKHDAANSPATSSTS